MSEKPTTMRMTPLSGLLLAAIVAVAGADQGARLATTRVVGVVYDSISHGAVVGALVQLVSASARASDVRLTTVSDSAGRFAFPPVERGRFVLGFLHPKLDSLGVEAPLTRLELTGDSVHAVELAVPGIETVLRRSCGRDARRDSSGAMVGYAREANASAAARGIVVRARWSEIVIGRRGAEVRVREARAESGDDGWYALCQVPAGGRVLVGAAVARDSAATLEVEIPNDGLLVRDLYVAAPRDARAAPSAGVRGTVRTMFGDPLPGARVRLFGESREVRSNERGEFALAGLPTGTQMLEVRALGYAPRRELVDLLARREFTIDVGLEEFPTTIDTVRVFSARRDDRDPLAGFARRRALSQGVFLDPDAVERRRPLNFTDLMQGIAGVNVLTTGGARSVVMRSLDGAGDCEPELIVDGIRLPRYESNIDDLIPASVIRAIEVYPRRMQAPPEYQSLTCGSIVVWTGPRGWLAKRGKQAPPKR